MDVKQPGGQYHTLPVAVVHPEHDQEIGWQAAGVDVEQPGAQYHALPGAVVHPEHDQEIGW